MCSDAVKIGAIWASKTGQLRARRQNVPTPGHTQARIGALDHLHQHAFHLAGSPPSSPSAVAIGGQSQHQQQSLDLASTVDLTADNRTPIDYLTPPPNGDFQFHSFFQPASGAVDPTTTVVRTEPHQQIATAGAVTAASVTAAIQTPPPSPFIASSPFTSNGGGGGGGGFPFAQAQPPPTASSFGGSLASSSSNQVHSLSFTAAGGQPLEQFTPYTPTLAHEPAAAAGAFNNQLQPPHQLQQQNVGTRWELGFDANDILTPPFAGATEQPGGGGPAFFQQEFGPEAASSVRHTKQYLNGGGSGGVFDPVTASNNNNRFTPLDGVLRSSSNNNNNNNNNVYWGTPKTAQQQPVRPSPTFVEPNAYRFNSNGNQVHLHHGHHANGHHHQYVDAFQMPFTGQFDGPLSQGTVADHVVHSSFRIKRDLGDEELPSADRRDGIDDEDADDHGDARFGDHKPVFSFVKTDTNGNFKWSVRHGY